jgi:O-antigen ligase
MTGLLIANHFDRIRLARVADGLAVAVAVSLPWSTSATSILIVAWLLALIPTLSWADLRRELTTAAGGLPVLLVLFGLLGMLWANVTLFERWEGFESFPKLLVIPLLLVQFRHSDGGTLFFVGYLWSCIVLMVASTIVLAVPQLSASLMHYDYVLVKNAATQSGEFVTCIAGLLFLGVATVERRRWWLMLGMLAVVLGMLANIVYVATGRTALVVILVLLVLFAAKQLRARGMAILFSGAIAVLVAGWLSSPYLRERTRDVFSDIQKYQATDKVTPSGERIEFYKKSIAFVRTAPIVGHGTGSMTSLFKASAIGQTGPAATATTNPHNQTFAVAIQLGLIGAAVLWAVWLAHLALFRGHGLAEWVGLVIVVQNIIGSLFNSHLFDFTQGWVYVLGVGVAGGMALKKRMTDKSAGLAS